MGDAKRKRLLLEKLNAKEMKWGHINKDAEKKMIEKMVLLQLE